MQKMSAQDAKSRFGQLIDTARREPVTIEKHGRPVAVIISIEDFDEFEASKLARLKSEIALGMSDLDEGRSKSFRQKELSDLSEQIKAEGRRRSQMS